MKLMFSLIGNHHKSTTEHILDWYYQPYKQNAPEIVI